MAFMRVRCLFHLSHITPRVGGLSPFPCSIGSKLQGYKLLTLGSLGFTLSSDSDKCWKFPNQTTTQLKQPNYLILFSVVSYCTFRHTTFEEAWRKKGWREIIFFWNDIYTILLVIFSLLYIRENSRWKDNWETISLSNVNCFNVIQIA